MGNNARVTDQANDRSFGKVHYCQSSVDFAVAEARVITLEPGITEVTAEYIVRDGDTLRGAPYGSTLRASASFKGRAIVVLESGATVERLTIDGNRAKLASVLPLAPYDRTFADFYPLTAFSARVHTTSPFGM